MLFEPSVDFEKASPAGKDVLDSSCQCFVLRSVNIQLAEVENQPLAGTVFSTDAFYQIQV
ncbi:MAG: hypothetical protein DRP49_01285 [Spirochaetes bacterium]|nr:MAG: hypothetical protein DRP49_01285 [Spirochaetota bacterium]